MKRTFHVNHIIHKILMLLMASSLISCLYNDKDVEEPKPRWQTNGLPTYFLDDTIKKFTVFPVGSWWVYEDSVTGKRDRIEVKSLNTEVSTSERLGYNKEVSTMILSSSYLGYDISAGSSATDDTSSTGSRRSVYGETVLDSQSPSGGGKIFFTSDIDSLYTYRDNINDYGLIHRNWFYSRNGFKSVYSFTHPFQKTQYSYQIGFFASGVGQIRKEMFNGEVWNLVNYHIAK